MPLPAALKSRSLPAISKRSTNASWIVPACTASTPTSRTRAGSEEILERHKAGDDEDQERREYLHQVALEEHLCLVAEEVEQRRLAEEARTARDRRQHHKQRKTHPGDAGGDGHQLVGDRRQAL